MFFLALFEIYLEELNKNNTPVYSKLSASPEAKSLLTGLVEGVTEIFWMSNFCNIRDAEEVSQAESILRILDFHVMTKLVGPNRLANLLTAIRCQ